MADNSRPQRDVAERAPDDRLESWKRIAAYLNRDVRTLRRWERNEGLPVHRQMHDKLATVYAYKSELDAWREGRVPEEGGPKAVASSADRTPRESPRLLLVLLVVVAGAAGAWYGWPSRAPELPFAARDWVLIAHFDNLSGDALLDDTVEYALERELSNSPFVNVVPGERIIDALGLMKLPPDTRIDARIGREISLRDGGIRVLLTGRVENFGGRYLLTTSLVNPVSGVNVASFSREATGREAILPAVRGLAGEVRVALGESLTSIRLSEERLAKVTTPSLRALRLYSQAEGLMKNTVRREQALPLLERAVGIDPDFASAHVLLWYLLTDRGQEEQASRHIERAVQLADGTPDRERYFILATYYQYLGDIRKTVDTLELLLDSHPDHYWATGNLGVYYLWLGEPHRAAPYRMKRAELRPNNPLLQYDAASVATVYGDMEAADRHAASARALLAGNPDFPWIGVALDMLPVAKLWIDGDLAGARDMLDTLAAGINGAPERDYLQFQVRSMYLALGDMKGYETLSPLPSEPDVLLALVHRDDPRILGAYLDHAVNSFHAAVLHARAGRLEVAEVAIGDPASAERLWGPFTVAPWADLARGEVALARGDVESAVELLDSATRRLRMVPTAFYFLGRESLVRAYESQGRPDLAIAALEETANARDESIFHGGATYLWMQNRLQLMERYRATGRNAAAREVESELRGLLALADSNHPVMAALDR